LDTNQFIEMIKMNNPLCQFCGKELLILSQIDLDKKILTWMGYCCPYCHKYFKRKPL